MLAITKSNFEKEVTKSTKPIAVDFWAEWCGPCKMMGPVFEELSKELAAKGNFAKLDVDTNQELSAKYGVMSIPTIVVFKGGKEAGRIMGFVPKPILKQKLEALL